MVRFLALPHVLYLTYLRSWSSPWAVLAWAPGPGSKGSGKAWWILGWKTQWYWKLSLVVLLWPFLHLSLSQLSFSISSQVSLSRKAPCQLPSITPHPRLPGFQQAPSHYQPSPFPEGSSSLLFEETWLNSFTPRCAKLIATSSRQLYLVQFQQTSI